MPPSALPVETREASGRQLWARLLADPPRDADPDPTIAAPLDVETHRLADVAADAGCERIELPTDDEPTM